MGSLKFGEEGLGENSIFVLYPMAAAMGKGLRQAWANVYRDHQQSFAGDVILHVEETRGIAEDAPRGQNAARRRAGSPG